MAADHRAQTVRWPICCFLLCFIESIAGCKLQVTWWLYASLTLFVGIPQWLWLSAKRIRTHTCTYTCKHKKCFVIFNARNVLAFAVVTRCSTRCSVVLIIVVIVVVCYMLISTYWPVLSQEIGAQWSGYLQFRPTSVGSLVLASCHIYTHTLMHTHKKLIHT